MSSFLLSRTPADRSAELSERRLFSLARAALAVLALLIILIDPTEPDRFVAATYTALVTYALFSLAIYWAARKDLSIGPYHLRNPYWFDVVWYLLLITLSSGTGSVFFFFFYFSILNAAFTDGYKAGLRMTLVAAAGFSVLGYTAAIAAGNFELHRFLLRPVGILVVGYVVSHWGGHQKETRDRLRLLREIGLISNPRFGVDRTLGMNLGLLRQFFDAKRLILIEPCDDGSFRWRECSDANPLGALASETVGDDRVLPLLDLEPSHAVYYGHPTQGERGKTLVLDREQKDFTTIPSGRLAAIAAHLDCQTFVSAPVALRVGSVSRLYLCSDERFVIDESDLEFLLQTLDHFSPIVENIGLVDRMASDAADDERRRIARDIHDSVIQPYIGLRLGIESLLHYVSSREEIRDIGVVQSRLAKLKELTDGGILDLRAYMQGLTSSRGESDLERSLGRFASKFTAATGIKVSMSFAPELRIGDRLAAEVFQMLTEALSNVRRHSEADEALIEVTPNDGSLRVRISNPSRDPETHTFIPKSITERTRLLGGSVDVLQSNGTTDVKIQIPL